MTTPSSLGEQIKQLARDYRHGEGWPIHIYSSLARSVDALVSLAEASAPAREAGAVGGWISVDERLPKVIDDGKSVNSVLVLFAADRAPEVGSRWMVANTVWAQKAVMHGVTHWMPLPAAPLYTQEKAE